MQRTILRPWMALPALLLVCALAYGVTIRQQGFYWDDWTIVWYIHFLGASSFKAAFASDRPLLAWIYQVTTPLLGESPFNWQAFAVITRWLACAALWWALRGLWPRNPLQTSAIAILFAVYPGFKQQHIAITYSNAFLVLALYLSSWGFMIWSLRRLSRFWLLYLISLLLAIYTVFTAEHFFGLELLRPVFLWIVLSETVSHYGERLKKTLLLWLPFLAIDLAFLVWRISNPTPRAQITLFERLTSDPSGAVISLAETVLRDILTASFSAWSQIFRLDWLSAQPPGTTVRFVVIALAAAAATGLALIFAAGHRRDIDARAGLRWAIPAIGLGLFSLLAGGIPIWPTNLRLELFFPWDRFTLPMMFGAALLLAGLIELLNFAPPINMALVVVCAGLAAGFHYQIALSFRADWLSQRDFFWQLAWRVPGLEPGTILLTSDLPFEYDWDNSLTAPLNWTYAPQMQGTELPYLMYNAESRLSSGLPPLDKNTRIQEYLRITPFSGSISQAVVGFYQPPGSCFKLIDPQIDQNLPEKPRYFKEIYSFSRLDLVHADAAPPAQPPLQFFEPEPPPNWCYYFQKAELARQTGNWNEIVELGEKAFETRKTFTRKNVYELLPFIEGYARSNQFDRAYEMTRQGYQTWEKMGATLCLLWDKISADASLGAEIQSASKEIHEELKCSE
ncbi:MAG: hypothetical protein B6D39_02150 [Anaerolineae bacterium UTCFX2]|jgi:hypothetical protein|nr:hypothetical protein [Anaerolineales bacterium]OQY94066.1 MAG: hypothetical protein B6D39_02150 [Anaerolineae bacterium UTCFX2]